jgi:isoleucyl-tRNA synthetase
LEDVEGVAVVSGLSDGDKCERCWRILPEVATHDGKICGRCADTVG